MAVIALAAPLLGGSTEPWSQGVILILIGIGLMIAPPRCAPHRFAWLGFAAAVLLAAAAFLPSGFVSNWPVRATLESTLQIPLPASITPQPWLTLDSLVLLIAGIAWWWWVATNGEANASSRARLTTWIGAGMIAIALLSLAARDLGVSVPSWSGLATLGPFPNKNQTGNLLGTWAIVLAAVFVDRLRNRRGAAIFWLLGLAMVLWALLGAQSRGGTLVFIGGILGCGLWEGLRAARYRTIGIAVASALCGLAGFFALGGESFQRLARIVTSTREGGGSADFRLEIFADTFRLIEEAPWSGIGLGNFESLFVFYRDASAVFSRVLHPESDWLWLVAELGWLALPICAVLLVPILKEGARAQGGRDESLLRAARIAGIMFLLHGMVDVSGHRLGSALPGLFLLGIGTVPMQSRRRSAAPKLIFRAIAVLLICFGSTWLIGTFKTGFLPGRLHTLACIREAREALDKEDFARTEAVASEGLSSMVLDWELHFLRGTARMYQGKLDAAHADFRRARALESTNADIAAREGGLWAYFDAPRSEEAWAAALYRSGKYEADAFRSITGTAREYPAVLPILERLARHSPPLQLQYLELLPVGALRPELSKRLEPAWISSLSGKDQRTYFDLWRKVGNRLDLEPWLSAHPEFLPAAWRLLADQSVESGDHARAVHLALKYLPTPELPKLPAAPLDTARREFLRNPGNIAAGYQTYAAERKAGLLHEALTTLDKLDRSSPSLKYLPYLRASVLADLQDWKGAWNELKPIP